MKDKLWYQSKTIWAGLIVIGIGVAQAFGIDLPYEVIYSLCAGLGLVGVRQAVAKTKR